MNTKHTAGPWACTYTSNHAHDYRLTKANGAPLPVNAPSNDRSDQRANAALIASAPDLLSALEMILSPSPHYGATQAYRYHVAAARAAGLAAIAKARGEVA